MWSPFSSIRDCDGCAEGRPEQWQSVCCWLPLFTSHHLLLDMHLTLSAFRIALTVILLALIIIFQQDIRRGSEQFSTWRFYGRSRAANGSVDTLLEAVSLLAKEKIGALFAIQGRQPIEPQLVGGKRYPSHESMLCPAGWTGIRSPVRPLHWFRT